MDTNTVIMSGNMTGQYFAAYGLYKNCFYNSVPAPNYLMNVVSGILEYTSTGYNTGFWAEPSIVGVAATDFDNLQALLDTTENWVQTAYIWGNYTIVVMPPAFPESGMSNPMLSYASATTIIGDKSLEYVQLRNLVQSWIGNQVTNQNWADLWLNEGIATFVYRSVIGQAYNIEWAECQAFSGNISLSQQTNAYGL